MSKKIERSAVTGRIVKKGTAMGRIAIILNSLEQH